MPAFLTAQAALVRLFHGARLFVDREKDSNMCQLTVAVDQSIHNVTPIFDAVESSGFFIRSIRVVPVVWSLKADLLFSLGGGSDRDMTPLLMKLKALPAVLGADHVIPSW